MKVKRAWPPRRSISVMPPGCVRRRRHATCDTRLPGIAFAVGLHVAAIVWLLQFESVRRELVLAAPIMVNLISPPQVAVAPPKPPPNR